MRLNDILNTLTSVPSKMRILMLDACRNNPFPDISKTAGGGLAIVDAKVGSPGTFLSFSTSPGAVAEDGTGSNSPYTTALLAAGKESGIPIEETFKRVRLAVNKVTEGRQTPWDSSSLTEDFRFSGTPVAGPKPAAARQEDGCRVDARSEGQAGRGGQRDSSWPTAPTKPMKPLPPCTRRRRSAGWRATGSIATCAWWRGITP